MEGQTQNFVDNRPADVQLTNPIEKSRRSTNILFIFIFLIIIFAWIGVGTKGLLTAQRQHFDEKIHKDRSLVTAKSLINSPLTSFNWRFIIILTLCVSFTLIFIFLIGQHTEFYVFIGLALYMLYVIISLVKIISGPKSFFHDVLRDVPPAVSLSIEAFTDICLLLQTIFMIVCFISLSKLDKKIIFNIIKDASRVILASPSVIILAGFLSILAYLIVSFTLNALISELSSDQSHLIGFECFVIVFGGICALSFVYNFSFMVVSVQSVNYYWRNEHTNVVTQVLRNHIGTITFSSILFLPSLCSIVEALKHKLLCTNEESYIFYLITKFSLTLNMPNTALILSSIYGTDFIKSSRNAFDAILRQCSLYLATLGALDALISVLILCKSIIVGVVLAPLFFIHYKEVDLKKLTIYTERDIVIMKDLIFGMFGVYLPLFAFVILIYTSARALLINKIIILNKENQEAEGNSEMLNRW